MLKRLTLLFMALCLIFCLAACGKPASTAVGEPRPENWDVEAEVLRFCNGYFRAKTAEELKPYVLSETANARIKEFVDELNASLSGLVDTLDYRDYPYDSMEVTYLDTYEGFEILWVKTSSTAFQQAVEEYTSQMHSAGEDIAVTHISPNVLLVLAIENGHYVASLDEAFSNEVRKKYDYCQSCDGQGGIIYLGSECRVCKDAGTLTEYFCQDCQEVFVAEEILRAYYDEIEGIWKDTITDLPCEYPNLPLDPADLPCYKCGSSNLTTTQVTCDRCLGFGGKETTFETCTTCNGNGWVKK